MGILGPWEVVLLIMIFFGIILISRYKTKRICPKCGFAIRSYTSECPECGVTFPRKKKLQERR